MWTKRCAHKTSLPRKNSYEEGESGHHACAELIDEKAVSALSVELHGHTIQQQ